MSDDGDSGLDDIAADIGTVEVSDGYLAETEVETGEQFGYDSSR
jgi:hypothetical protein